MNYDLKIIKDNYGERLMHLCREFFPTLLEKEGLLSSLLLNKFSPSKFLYEDIVENNKIEDFKNYIYNLVDVEKKEKIETNKTPKELLSLAGYDLYECKTEEEIQSFKRYYEEDEELCTFNGDRLNRCYVFFAVKKDVDNIKRKNFKFPKRDDLYGTSVMSIQFTKGNTNTLSIKNRYNHTVNNPDATLSNNLENIIPGLTESFERTYNLRINQTEANNFEIPNYIKASDGKYYKYNYELDNIYYCPNNVIIDNFEVKKFPKERYIILDYFIIDLKEKTLKNYKENMHDCFPNSIDGIEKISVTKENNNKIIKILTITNNEVIIKLDNQNRIISYKNNKLDILEDNFLRYNETLENLDTPNVEVICNNCLEYNEALKELYLHRTRIIENNFLIHNICLENIYVPKLESVRGYFLYRNKGLKSVDFPNLKYVGDYFLYNNEAIEYINFPLLEEVCMDFMSINKGLTVIDFPKLKYIRDGFITSNYNIKQATFPEVLEIGNGFLRANESLNEINLPKVNKIGSQFMYINNALTKIEMPLVEEIGASFLRRNKSLKSIKFPNLKAVADSFLSNNKDIYEAEMPLLEQLEFHFLFDCVNLFKFSFPKLNEESKKSLKNAFDYRANNVFEDDLYDSKIIEVKKENIILKFINKIFGKNKNSIGGNHLK